MPGILLEDSLHFVEAIKHSVDYIHMSMGSYKRTSLNDPSDKEPILQKFAKQIGGAVPLITVGSIELPKDAEEAMEGGADLVAMGRELIREPKWIEKVMDGDEESIRTTLSPSEMTELSIPPVTQDYLQKSFYDVMHFTTDKKEREVYVDHVAPMEGFEKKL